MLKWQKIALFLSVLAFFASNSGRIRKCLIEESLPPSKRLTHEEVFNLSKEADSLYKHGLKIVAEKKENHKDFVVIETAMRFLSDSLRGFGFTSLSSKIKDKQYSLTRLYLDIGKEIYNSKSSHGQCFMNSFGQKLCQERSFLLNGRDSKVDWKAVFLFLHRRMCNFFPFLIIILFIIRWPQKKYYFEDVDDKLSFIFCMLIGPLGALIYWEMGGFEAFTQRFKYQLRQMKKREDNLKDFELVWGYIIAIFFALSFLKPSISKDTAIDNVKVTCSMPEDPKTNEEDFNLLHTAIVVLVNSYKHIFNIIREYFNFFVSLITIYLKITTSLLFIWGLWNNGPLWKFLSWVARSLGRRAPGNFVRVKIINYTLNNFKGVSNETIFFIPRYFYLIS